MTTGPGDAGGRTRGGTGMSGAIAAGVTVLVCVVVRLPDRLIQQTGLRGWAVALVGVIAMVNGARMLAQAPFTISHRSSSLARWAAGQLAALGGTVAIGAALTVPLYVLIRASSLWWLRAWAMFAGVTIAGQAALPLIVRAQVGPLDPASVELAERVRAIGFRAGVDVGGGVLIARRAVTKVGKAAHRGSRPNAYVVGLGPTRRVVLEAGLAAWPPQLVDQVVAHEIGHWRLGHATRRLPVTIAAQLATFALAGLALSWPPLLDWAGIAAAGDPRSYPLLLGLTPLLVLPARVLLAAYDRSQERAADRFALATLAEPKLFACMLEWAALEGGAPRHLPWWRKVTASHPPIDERILACRPAATSPDTQRSTAS